MRQIKLSEESIALINKVLVKVINHTDSRGDQADAKKAFSDFLRACDEGKEVKSINYGAC